MIKNIRQNLFFAFIYNSIGVPVAAGVLYPVFGILLSPVIAFEEFKIVRGVRLQAGYQCCNNASNFPNSMAVCAK